MPHSSIQRGRDFLKDSVRLEVDFVQTDQGRGIPAPPLERPAPADAARIDLVRDGSWPGIGPVDLKSAIRNRRSRRRFTRAALSLEELSFLLWATQGIEQRAGADAALRTVPSAGARHALETYLCIFRVEGLDTGVYRYLPLTHQLVSESAEPGLSRRLGEAALGQSFVGRAAAMFIWTAIPYRMEWRYGAASHRLIAIDAGHICQNLYLACEAIGAGTCAVAAYDQELLDRLLRVDGHDEFAVYLAPVGKV